MRKSEQRRLSAFERLYVEQLVAALRLCAEAIGDCLAMTSRARAGRGTRIVAHLRGRVDVPMSTDAIMALTRGE